jgi:hypothetical protein
VTLATSKNLTVLGIAGILAALSAAAIALFDGDPTTNVDLGALATAIGAGVVAILSKGAKTTGGTVDPSGNPVP